MFECVSVCDCACALGGTHVHLIFICLLNVFHFSITYEFMWGFFYILCFPVNSVSFYLYIYYFTDQLIHFFVYFFLYHFFNSLIDSWVHVSLMM